MSYILYRLSLLDDVPNVIYESRSQKKVFLFDPKRDKVTTLSSFDDQLFPAGEWDSPKTWYLFDPYGQQAEEPTTYRAFTVVASSPNERHYHSFRRRVLNQFYMPAWEDKELDAIEVEKYNFITESKLTQKMVKEHLRFFGSSKVFVGSRSNH